MNSSASILYLITLGLCLAVVCTGYSQHSIRGLIMDDTQEVIEQVEIFHHESGRVVTTDAQGVFLLSDLRSGMHRITIFSPNYVSFTDSILVQEDVNKKYTLARLSLDLSVVEVSARREELFALRQLRDVEGTSIYAGKKSEVVLMDLVTGALANNNSRQIYAKVAGLNIYEGSDGGLQLGIGGRGLDPNRTANFNTRQNDYDISADVLGYPENYYTPPSEAISEIQIIRGASSLQYGTQFGGLINFKIRPLSSQNKLHILTKQTLGSFGFLNSFNALGYKKNKFSIHGYFNHKKGDGYRDNANFKANNIFISSKYTLSSKTSIQTEFTFFSYLAKQAGGLTDDQFKATPRLSTRSRNWFEVDWKLYNVRLDHEFNPSASLSLSVFALDASRKSLGYRGNPVNLNENVITALDEQDSQGNFISPRDLIIGNFKNYGAEIRYLKKYNIYSKKAILLLGGKLFRSNNTSIQTAGSQGINADFSDYSNVFSDYSNQSTFSFPNRNLALFGEHIFYLSDQISLTPGFRWEYIKTVSSGSYKQVNFDNAGNPISNTTLRDDRNLERSFVLFGLGLEYKRSEALNLYANISQNYRSVTFSDIRVVSPAFVVDPDIIDEKGITFDLGLRGRWNKALSYDVSAFTVLYNNRIGIILDDRANRRRKNIGNAFIAGVESLIDLNIARLIKPEDRSFRIGVFANTAFTYSEYISSEEQNVLGKRVEFIPNVNLKTGAQVGYKNVLASIQLTYLSLQFTDAQNSQAALQGDIRNGIIGPIPSYRVLDLSLSYNFKRYSLEMGVNNFSNVAYFTRRATGYPGPGIIPSDGRSYYITVGYRDW